jgi:hypothetical protein
MSKTLSVDEVARDLSAYLEEVARDERIVISDVTSMLLAKS